jgi:Asp-tRNA(Asn)/Glu-tRNA(Gln) amidotransferase A subunit family amidase
MLLAAFAEAPSPVPPSVGRPPRIAALALDHVALAPAVRIAHAAALERISAVGLSIDTLCLDAYDPASAAHALLVGVEAEGATVYGEWLASGAVGLSPSVRDLFDWGARLPAKRRDSVRAELRTIDAAVRAALFPYSGLLLPATPRAAFDFADGPPANVAWFTSLASITGLPAAVVPIGLDEAGRPLAIQIVSWSDASTLAAAAAIEKACGGVPAPPRFAV